MAIVLIGPPAAGKTRVGKRLAALLSREFIDTDKVIVAEHGPIAEIFSTRGEPEFRRLERDAVIAALPKDAVVSLGGGAVLNADTQRDLADAQVVLLTISPDAVVDRIDNGKRPLIQGIESWQRIHDARIEIYRSLADYTTDTSHRALDDIAREIADWAKEHQ